MNTELTNKIRRGEIDINNQSLFFSILIKGLLQQLKKDLKIRNIGIPHFILNTGDDTMYLEVKGQNQSIEPVQVSNEDYVYNIKPRCIVEPRGVNLIPDQLTSPYSKGVFQLEYENELTSFTAEFRRYPLTMSFELNYYLESYTDSLELLQQIITKLSFIRTFSIVYMGQHITCSYTVPESMDTEYNIQIEGTTGDSKDRKINLSLVVETNIPVYDTKTVIQNDHFIQNIQYNVSVNEKLTDSKIIINNRDVTIDILEEKIKEYERKDKSLTLLLREILTKINKKEIYEQS